MSNATDPRAAGLGPKDPKPSRRRRPRYGLKVWRCGLCNVRCKTVLDAGGLCSVCRQQPNLPGVYCPPEDAAGGEW
jgi:hypothetical protein